MESVIINRFEDNVFHAKLFTQHDKPREADCPPVKALGLGVRAEALVFADKQVLEKAAITVHA